MFCAEDLPQVRVHTSAIVAHQFLSLSLFDTAAMCNFSDALPASSCAPGYRCITHNTTGSSHCLQSCYLQNGGCSDDEVCYYERKDEECNQLLEPCFKTTCTDDPGTNNLSENFALCLDISPALVSLVSN